MQSSVLSTDPVRIEFEQHLDFEEISKKTNVAPMKLNVNQRKDQPESRGVKEGRSQFSIILICFLINCEGTASNLPSHVDRQGFEGADTGIYNLHNRPS